MYWTTHFSSCKCNEHITKISSCQTYSTDANASWSGIWECLTFAERLDEAHEVGCLAGAQDLTQGPDVVLGEAQSLDLGQLLGFGVARHDLPQAFQRVVQPMHAVPLAGIGLHPADFKSATAKEEVHCNHSLLLFCFFFVFFNFFIFSVGHTVVDVNSNYVSAMSRQIFSYLRLSECKGKSSPSEMCWLIQKVDKGQEKNNMKFEDFFLAKVF